MRPTWATGGGREEAQDSVAASAAASIARRAPAARVTVVVPGALSTASTRAAEAETSPRAASDARPTPSRAASTLDVRADALSSCRRGTGEG